VTFAAITLCVSCQRVFVVIVVIVVVVYFVMTQSGNFWIRWISDNVLLVAACQATLWWSS
jgi:hypothetical protein